MEQFFAVFNGEITNKILKLIDLESIYALGWKLFKVILLLIIMYFVVKIGNRLINKYMSTQKNFKFSLDDKKAKTVAALLKSILKYTVYFFGIFCIIEILFSKIGLTFAGIGGVAVGLGSQSIIKDVINGFFILFENQFSVGDYINIDDKGGIVESIELRVTKIRDFNGDLHIIPNGLISKVTNHSRGNIRISVDIDISHDEDVNKAIEVISNLCENFKRENDCITEGPKVLGITAFSESGLTIRVAGKTKPMMQWDAEMKLRKEMKEALEKENIRMPYPMVKIVKE